VNKSRCSNCGRKASTHLTVRGKGGVRIQVVACERCVEVVERRLMAAQGRARS
jgi:hypothetical protein